MSSVIGCGFIWDTVLWSSLDHGESVGWNLEAKDKLWLLKGACLYMVSGRGCDLGY